MIDLSHLTEEEQGMIMSVLRRDAELKKAEDARISKLEKIFNSGSALDTQWKYLTGEWFYEAKSRRHMDKIHGSEIILASITQKKAPSEGSLSTGRYKTSIRRGSDIVAPPKPDRCLETLQPQAINDAKTTESNKSMNPTVRSPRMPRQNPFNRASLIDYEPPESSIGMSSSRDQETSGTESISPLKKHQGEEASQTSGESVMSDTSAAGFRPVPKKRTFLSRSMSSMSERSGQGLDAQGGSAAVVPAPRQSLQQWTSVSSSQSYPRQGEMLQKSQVSHQVSQTAPSFKSHDENSHQQLSEVSQVSSNSSVPREETQSSLLRDRWATNTWSDVSTDRTIPRKNDVPYDETQRECAALDTVILYTGRLQDSDREDSVGSAMRQEELSLPQSFVDPDPPISYDLNFIDKSDDHNQKHVFKLSTPTTSPIGEEDSIAKVLDWFSRSTDSIDWPNTRAGPEAKKSSEKHVEIGKLRGEDSLGKNAGDIRSDHLQKQTHETKELSATDSVGNNELTKIQEMRKYERQPAQISQLKSFWEGSKIGPKILSTKSLIPGDNGQKPDQLSAGKDENVNKPHGVSDISSVYIREGPYGDEREQQLVDSPQKHTGDSVHLNRNQEVNSLVMNSSSHGNSDHSNLAANLQTDKRGSDTETLSLTGLSPQRRTAIESRLSPESESVSLFKSNPQLQKKLSKTAQNSPYMDYKRGQTGALINLETQTHKGPYKDVNWWEKEDKTKQVSMSPKQQEDMSNRESPYFNRQGSTHQESPAERIKQLKSFWEQERKPMYYNGKPKPLGEGKINCGPSQAKLNKRFTKSEFDLRSIRDYSDNNEEGAEGNQNFTIVPPNQKIEKSSPTLSTSRAQFNTLREFWDETTSDTKGSFSSDKSKSPKRKDRRSTQLPPEELVVKSSPPNHLKSPHDRQSGSRDANDSKNHPIDLISESKKSPEDFNREEKFIKPQSSSGKETCFSKNRKDSFRHSSSRANSMRRAASLFALCVSEESDQSHVKMDASPVHSQSERQWQNAKKDTSPRSLSGESETLTPRARARIPKDYRHYLGMMDKTSVHTSLTPTLNNEESGGKSGYEIDLGGPVRASTPVSSEDRCSSKSSKTSQRPLWTNYSSSDTGQESSVSSTSRNSSNRDSLNPVRKALRRAEARPKNLAKSMEDMTASLSPRQERRQDVNSDIRHISDASPIPSPSSSLFTDPDHLKKMSKSVPMFLENEDDGDTDSNLMNSYYRGRLMKGNSFTNLSSSSGMASVSSLSGSVMTMYSGDLEVQGSIQFSINYIQKLKEFHIFVAECRDLAAADPKRGRSDPYVKSYLVPDKGSLGKRKTSVKKKTLSPTFNEILRYRVHMDYLRSQTLILSVWHHDTFGRNSFLGEVDVDLSKWDFEHTRMNYLALKAKTSPSLVSSSGRGEMRVAIRFLPQIAYSEGLAKEASRFYTGEIHIWVKECKNLPLIRATIDPYVKCFVLPDTSRKSRQKTRVLRRTADPVFNHTMVYDGIRDADLAEACVELSVWDRDRLASHQLGGLRLGVGTGQSYGATVNWMDSTPAEVAFWERMKATPNEWVEDVLPLRMLNSAKTAFK